ncbi:uncharacterized protein LOC119473634 [Cebus imitator]|uniref:uncharacterized protein LOC119473634 n=1 Tax=Cebus imitator TaxID=2715852 RepID=UPI00189A62DD|nr:uncharacterized protein LOC119473634 [Cebus imitator]
MVAAAAPSSALACRGLFAATRRARPERPPQGSDGVELRHRGFLRATGGWRWAGEGGRQARPGVGLWAPRYPLSGQPDGPAGLSGGGNELLGRSVLGALCCGVEALGPGRERPARTELTGEPGLSRAGPPQRQPWPRGLES